MSRITQELKSETKECILTVSTQMFTDVGFDRTKTKAIAQSCQIAEGTLFNYFPTKDDLLVAVFEHMSRESMDNIAPSLPDPRELLIQTALAPFRAMHHIHKSLLIDLLISSIRIAKKKPKLFHRLAELDFDYISKLKMKLDIYGDFSQQEINAQDVAEMVYSVAVAEFLLYLYRQEVTFNQFEQKIRPKIQVIMTPYMKGGLAHD